MILEIYENLLYYIARTTDLEVLWVVFPLAIATIVMVTYFQKYKEERAGWNTYVANSLVLLFISVELLRHISTLGPGGLLALASYPYKFLAIILVLVLGFVVFRLNFNHWLPERYAAIVNSPLTVNLLAYVLILYVYSEIGGGFESIISLIALAIILLVALHLLRILVGRFFKHMMRLRKKERINDIKQEKFAINELKREAKKREKVLKNNKLKELEAQKKEAQKLKRIAKTGKSRKRS